jgi:DNA polymerase-3 subunit epsilon
VRPLPEGAAAGFATWLRRLLLPLVGLAALLVACLAAGASRGVLLAGAVLLLGLALAASVAAELLLGRPADLLVRHLGIIARDNPLLPLPPRSRATGRLHDALAAVQARLGGAEAGREAALASATARVEAQKQRLEAVLLDLAEGVIVCGAEHQVLLFNQSALGFLDDPHAIGLGRPVFDVLSRESVLHQLDWLSHRGPAAQHSTRFVCATAGGGRLLLARLGLTAEEGGGYVLTFTDASAAIGRAARLERLVRGGIERQRDLLARLRKAAAPPGLAADIAALAEQNADLVRGLGELGGAGWPMAEVHTADLIGLLARRLPQGAAPVRIQQAGIPDWIHADSLSLLDLLDHLAGSIAREQGAGQITLAVARAHGMVTLDLIWSGEPVSASHLQAWLETPFAPGRSVADARTVLERHGTECRSEAGRDGEAMLRLTLPSAEEPAEPARRALPPRPEFYDFDLARRPAVPEALRERPLRDLGYVVFDVETTGLRLSDGDEVVSIGAVRVLNGRVLPLETFSRLVNPGRPIPPESVRFHGVTDAMVQGKPPFALVLPQFYRFVGDAVLVAHNAAFDMLAITRGARGCGLSFDNPLLDTLLISAWLDADESLHSLDAIARRLGIEVAARHDPLGDSLLTAAIFVRQLERLRQRGIERFGQLAIATDMAARVRQNQLQF